MKTLYISVDNPHSVDEVAFAFMKLLTGLSLDSIGPVTPTSVTVIEHGGSVGRKVTRKAKLTR